MGRRDQREKKDLEVEKENKPVEKEETSDRSVDEDKEPQPSQPPKKKAKASQKVSEAEDEASPVTDEETDAGETKKEKKDDADKKRKIKKRRRVDANHPPTVDMVLESLMALDEKKGTTIKAMKDYIVAQNTVRPVQLSHLMRKALLKLLAKELIIRPKGEENKSVMLGRYKIAPRKKEDKQAPRERPATLRKLRGGNDALKKKKKRRKGFY